MSTVPQQSLLQLAIDATSLHPNSMCLDFRLQYKAFEGSSSICFTLI